MTPLTPASAASKRRRLRYHELRRLGIEYSLVPAGPVVARIVELNALGWSCEAIAAWNGDGTAAAVHAIRRGRSANVERKFAPIADLPITAAVPAHLPDSVLVPSLGARRRVQGLLRLGWHHTDITAAAGVTSYSFARGNGSYRRMRAGDWRAINHAYELLSGRPGPSEITRQRAARAGYHAPLAWDDIDDPAETPDASPEPPRDHDDVDHAVVTRILAGEWRLPATRAEKEAVVAAWRGGYNDLERLTGWNLDRYYAKGTAA